MPPVADSLMEKPSTTTLSLIGVRAGDHTTIVIAMLKSLGYIELRIDEMNPRLLETGSIISETSKLLGTHKDLVGRLRSKQDQVEQLLAGADKLVTEQKTEDGIIVYEAMAESLGVAWRELNRQLDLRGYILEDTFKFYTEAEKHSQIINQINNLLRLVMSGPVNKQLIAEVQAAFNRLLDITANAVDLGSGIITQIRTLGNLADNPNRPMEVAEACSQIEKIMLRLAQEWESVDNLWGEQKERLGLVQKGAKPLEGSLADQFEAVAHWLRHAQSQLAHGADSTVVPKLIQEARQQKENVRRLQAQAQAQKADPLVVRGRELTNAIDALLKQLEERSQLGNRIKAFLNSADTMLHQLNKMETDLSDASAAIASELGPLAEQKATAVIEEGQNILKSGHNDQVGNALNQLQRRLQEIENLAQHRIYVGNQLLKTQIANLTSWLKDTAEPFLTSNGNLGNDFSSANDFVNRHKQFAADVVNKEHEVNTVLNRAHELNNEDRRLLSDFEQRYENLKQTLEGRIQIGNNFQQVQKFGRELDSSFQTLTTLLDGNRDFSNEGVSQQMNNVFHMIQETLQQERHQADKFTNNTRSLTAFDVHLNCDQAIDSVRNLISKHEQNFVEITRKWQNWQKMRIETKTATSTVEEVQMWQVDTYETIRNLELAANNAQNIEEREHVRERVEKIIHQVPAQQQKLQEIRKVVNEKQHDDTYTRVQHAVDTNTDIHDRLQKIHNKLTQTTETFVQEDSAQVKQAPRLVTPLRDAQVDEGSRFEFVVRVESEPEPKIMWSKDGLDVKNNVDYRQNYLNGVASLTIEETFIEDTAVYTVRVQNPYGEAESSARLIVKSKSQLGPEGQKPRFVKQLNNANIIENEFVRLECVVVGQPEPQVVWYKDETTIVENERIKLEFRGDRCALNISKIQPSDAGIYKVAAKNLHGETTNFCRVNVQSATPTKKAGPPTAPKPPTPIHEPPAFNPSLVNQTLEEGSKCVFQVRITGQPFPQVQWKFKDQPIVQDGNVHIQDEKETGWSKVIIERIGPQHTGLYLCEAINDSGEARTGATLIVITPGQNHNIQQRSVTMIQSEGFWSDGGYTDGGGYTPPPVPQHKYIVDEHFRSQGIRDAGELGFSSIANAPDFVRPFQREYTVNEGEKTQIDCLLVGNPRPKIQWFFNEKPVKSNYQFAEFGNIGDTYSISFSPAKLENAGYYKMIAENIKGKAECMTVIHIRPRSLIPQPTKARKSHSAEHQKIVETFGAVDYTKLAGQRQQKHHRTPPPMKHEQIIPVNQMSQSYSAGQQFLNFDQKTTGIPPHFSQTLVSVVTTVGDTARFDGTVTGSPAPEVTWSKDGTPIDKQAHPHLEFSSIGGKVSLIFRNAGLEDSGKYCCTAKNASGVATSSAQLVVRPKTVAPDFIKRLISEEIVEGDKLHWQVRVTGDPLPKVTWLRDGQIIPNCDEVQLIDEGHGIHSMIIKKVEMVDGGQFTCLAENPAGEARSTADLVVRQKDAEPGTFFHITKVTQEKQVKGEEVSRNQTFSIENPRATPTR